jgi:hypothetical protein
MRTDAVDRRLDSLAATALEAERDRRWADAASHWCAALDPRPVQLDPQDQLALYEAAERCCERADRIVEALMVATRAVEHLGETADADMLVRLHERLAHYLAANDAEPDRVFAALKITIELGERRVPSDAYIQALLTGVGVLHERGFETGRNELLARAIAAADQTLNVALLRGSILPWVAYLRLLTGNITGCLEVLTDAWALPIESDDSSSTVVLAALLIDTLRRAGDFAKIDAIAVAGLSAAVRGGLDDTWAATCLRRNLAIALRDLSLDHALTFA